jgi:GDP-mannose 6-dehydrogenase
MVTLIETLLGKGLELVVYDRDVSLARLFGSNKEYIEKEIPHIAKLMRSSIDEVLNAANTIVIGNKSEEFCQIESRLRPDHTVIDLVRLLDRQSGNGYQGICW